MLALTGDAVDNVKGVPGIGDKGARDLIAEFGSLDALLEGADRVQQKRYREALLANADAARASRELVTIRTDVPIARNLELAALSGPGPGGLLRAVLGAGLPHASRATSRRPPPPSPTDYAIVESLDELADEVDGGAGRRPHRPPRHRRRCERDAGGHRGHRVLARRTPGEIRPARAPGARRSDQPRQRRSATRARRRCSRTSGRESRPRREVRRDRPRAARGDGGRPGLRHDAGQLPARFHAGAARARNAEHRAPRLQAPRPKRPCTEGARRRRRRPICPRPPRSRSRPSAPISRCSWRASCAARWRPKGWPGCTEHLEWPLVPVLVAIEQVGVRVDTTALGVAVEDPRPGDAGAQCEDLRAGRRGVQHQLAQAARRDPVREAQAARAEEDRQHAGGVDRRGRARRTRADATNCRA